MLQNLYTRAVSRSILYTLFIFPTITVGAVSFPGYFIDSAGQLILTSEGFCTKISSWRPELVIPQCGGKILEKEPVDSDGDGIVDSDDRCPETPARIQNDLLGCALDSDGDAIPDHRDACLNTPNNLHVDEKGCPRLTQERGSISLAVQFEVNQDVVKPELTNELRVFVYFMRTYGRSVAVIEGHTDSIGDSVYNRKLSRRRANSVRQYVIDNFGINSGRLKVVGYGEDKPVASNNTSEGRARNRRVVVVIHGSKETTK